jgi:peptide deformylase
MLKINDEYLGAVCVPVTAEELAAKNYGDLAKAMLATCWRTKPGRRVPTQVAVGLAANQLGLNVRMIVVDYAGFKGCMINPEILKYRGGTCTAQEGCLSFGSKKTHPIRHKIVVVEYLDETGATHRRKWRGLMARIVQHEVDHLDGITMYDRVKLGAAT